MKNIIPSPKYRLNWYKIILFSVAMVLTGIYSITVKGKTVESLKVKVFVSDAVKQSSVRTDISANTDTSTLILSVSTENIFLRSNSGSRETVYITSNTNWSITYNANWLEVSQVAGSNSATVAFTANSLNTGLSPRKAIVTISGSGVADKTLIVTQEYLEIGASNVGADEVYDLKSTSSYRMAEPITFNDMNINIKNTTIRSITIFHEGGTGNMLIGVYSDQDGSPSSLLGVSQSTPINKTAGWQTLPLISPVSVDKGQTIWLSWVFEDNPGVRYTSISRNSAESEATWSGGMPITFGNSTFAGSLYSLYCTYIVELYDFTFSISTYKISLGSDSQSKETFNITSNSSWSITTDADWLDVAPASGSINGTITLTANSANIGTTSRTATVSISGPEITNKTITVTQTNTPQNMGNITYQVWNNIGKSLTVSSLTNNTNYPNNPTSSKLITSMEGTTDLSENYGSRIVGYIHAPATGSYTFWIASDDYGELWLSTNDDPANKHKIAYVNGYTWIRQWNKYATQKSVTINLVEGQKYYIEALMKEATGHDNLAVGWLKPAESGTVPSEVIPGSVLSPYGTILVSSVTLPPALNLNTGASVLLQPTVLPANATLKTLNWTTSDPAVALVNSYGIVTGISTGNATITATSSDEINKSGTCMVTVAGVPDVCSATGNITYQVWKNIGSSTLVSSLTENANYPYNPTSSSLITSMEGKTDLGDGYGARIAGYICAPATGSYTFWIASDDYGELWLSTNDDPANKYKIAYVNGYTWIRTWNKYASQKSVTLNLVEGQKYYIEALMKEANGHDNLAVGWLKPGESGTVPSQVIPGSVLSPLIEPFKGSEPIDENTASLDTNVQLRVFPNPLSNGELNIVPENLKSEATLNIFTISGVKCFQKIIQSSGIVPIDRSLFNSGIYIIQLQNENFSKNIKLIVN